MQTRWCRICGEEMPKLLFRATKAGRRRTCTRCDSRRRMRARYLLRARPIPKQYLDPDVSTSVQRAIVDIESLERRGGQE